MDKLTTDVISNRVSGVVVDPETGDEYEAVFEDLQESERQNLADLEERANEGDESAAEELQEKVIEDYLIEPNLDIADLGVAWRQSIMVGFLRALGDNKAIESANEFFEDVEEAQGNR